MSKEIKYDDARFKILDGVTKISKVVGSTMGPMGRNVAISEYGTVHCTKDGVTTCRSVSSDDHFEDIGIQLLREASEKTNSSVGDGTTGSVILAESIYRNGLKHITIGGNPIQIRNGITEASKKVVDFIKTCSKSIGTKDEIYQVAKISSNHSDEIASILSDVFDKIGSNGTIKVETGNSTETESKIVEGMQFERGYVSPYFVTNDKMEANLDNPFIFIIDKKLSNIGEILEPLQAFTKSGRPMLIIADSIEGDALNTLVLNKLRGVPVCAVCSPSYGQNKKNILQDIAILTGGQVCSEESGISLNSALPDSGILGSAKQVIVTKGTTTIIDGKGEKEAIANRVEQLKNQIYNCKNEYDLKKMQERLAKLDGGVGIISVGANTESELKEKKDLVDDAFCAVKAAIVGGIVPGAGVILLRAKDMLNAVDVTSKTDSEIIGMRILADALDAPIKKIIENAGESADLIVTKILENDNKSYGYDVLHKEYGDLIQLGVVDPTNVLIAEIENAASIAGLLLTTSAVIVDIPEKKNDNPSASLGGAMPGMM